MRSLVVGLATGIFLAASPVTGEASTQSFDLLVTIAPDVRVVPVNSNDGYTILVRNTTDHDLAVEQVVFLLPGHGVPSIGQDVYGEPHESNDLSPAFTYVKGSTTGLTTADPLQDGRWLSWGGRTVPANSALSLHFRVKVSGAPAYYVSGATVDASGATVLGTAKGAQVQVTGSSQFSMTLYARAAVVPLGGRITYTVVLTNSSDSSVMVKEVKFHVTNWPYITGSTTGAVSADPVQKKAGDYRWHSVIPIEPHTSAEFSFGMRASVIKANKATGRAWLQQSLPDGQRFAGAGPSARVQVVRQSMTVTSSPDPLPDGLQGTAYAGATMLAGGGTTPYTFTVTRGVLPRGLALSSNGNLSGVPTEAGTFVFEVTATDALEGTGRQNFALTVAAPTITVSSSPDPLPDGEQGTAYPGATILASGGTAPHSFNVTAGTLPDGLTLSSDGSLTGTPTSTGTSTFTITATDSYGATGQASFTLTVAAPTITVSSSPDPLPDGEQGTAYPGATILASGGTAPHSFNVTAGTLPDGLTLSSDGSLTGTPTSTGTSTFTITATDSYGATGQASFTLTVAAPTITVSSSPDPLPDGEQGTAYPGATILASGGTAPHSFNVTAGTLPDGLTLSSDGSLTGTPTSTGTSTFTITATDSYGATGQASFTLTVL